MLNTQYSTITIIFILLVAVLGFSTVPCVASDDIGLLPFSRLASDSVKKQVGPYYQPPALEDALITALKNEGISAKLTKYPASQQPFTYDEIDAPQFDIDADDFATPEQILGDIASNQGFKQIIFGHIEEVSDDLYLVVRIYSASDIRSAEEQKINLKSLTPKEVEKALHQLAVKIKKILHEPQSQMIVSRNTSSNNILDMNDGLFGLDDNSKVGYSIEDIYRKILEYEFYVHPAKKHQSTIDNLTSKFLTTEKELKNELIYHSRSAKRRYHGTSYGPLLYMVTSKPSREQKKYFIAPSSEVFDLCIFEPYNPHFGFQWLTRDNAERILEKIRKRQINTDKGWMPLNDWRIPTIQELFAITQFLPLTKRAGKNGYSFWSDTLTANGELWTIRKFPTRFDQKGNLSKYGIDFDFVSPSSGDKALLVAVLTCPPP